MLASGDIVRVVNRDDRPLTIGLGGRSYVLPPDKEVPVPFDAAVIAFGDPRSGENMASMRDETGVVYWIPDRPTEVRRLRLKYGLETGNERTFEGTGGRIPDVRIFTIDGEPVQFVINDPSGKAVEPARITEQEREGLMAIVERQQRQIEMLLTHFNMEEGAVPLPKEPPDVPADVPAESSSNPLDIPEDDSTTNHTTSPAAHAYPVE